MPTSTGWPKIKRNNIKEIEILTTNCAFLFLESLLILIITIEKKFALECQTNGKKINFKLSF
jgi:hypothetical protein